MPWKSEVRKLPSSLVFHSAFIVFKHVHLETCCNLETHVMNTTLRFTWCYVSSTILDSVVYVLLQIVSADRPSHMYFDIEFSRSANPGLDGDAVVDRVVQMVKRLMKWVA